MKVASLLRTALLVGLAFVGCTDASLEIQQDAVKKIKDNKISISGSFCTEVPQDLVFPMRVVYLVDCSESMEVLDPPDPETGETGRGRAVRESVEQLLALGGDVKVSVVRFSAQAQPITRDEENGSYFTDDLEYVQVQLAALTETDRTTNYVQALSEAYAEMRDELSTAHQESLALSTYQVIMVTDGIPDVDSANNNEGSEEAVLESVEAIMELGNVFHLSKVGVNTALLSTGNAQVDAAAQDLLLAMSELGQGSFRAFASGGELNFLGLNLTSLKRMFTLKTLLAQNINATVRAGTVLADADGDGLGDLLEYNIGANPYNPDSDGDGCKDGVEYRYRTSGMDPLDGNDCGCYVPDYCFDEDVDGVCDNGCADADEDGFCDCIDLDLDGICDAENYTDSDGDGLFDCEEIYTGTSKFGADSDGDGLVDYMEVRFGTAPDVDDYAKDMDWDGAPNGEEVRSATDPKVEVATGRGSHAYRYSITEHDMEAGRICYDFEVSNITITDVTDQVNVLDEPAGTGPAGQGYSEKNRILVFAGEVPFDDPQSYARFKVACVEATYQDAGDYKNPPSGSVTLKDEDFVVLEQFKPETDCIPPEGR